MEKPTELCDLPEDMLVTLFSHLSLRDRLRVRQVSKFCRAAVGLSCTSTGRVFTDPRTTAAEVQQLLTEAGPRLSSLCASAELSAGLSPEQCARLTRLYVWKGDYFTSVELLALLERFPKAAVEVQCLSLRDNLEQLLRLHAQRARVGVVGSLDLSALKSVSKETVELVACLVKDDVQVLSGASSVVVASLSAERCARLTSISVWKNGGKTFSPPELRALLERSPLATVQVQNLALWDDAEQLQVFYVNRARLQVAGELNLSALRVVTSDTVELVSCLVKDDLCTSAVLIMHDDSQRWYSGGRDDERSRSLLTVLALRSLKLLKVEAIATEEGKLGALSAAFDEMSCCWEKGEPRYTGLVEEIELSIKAGEMSAKRGEKQNNWDCLANMSSLPITKLHLDEMVWEREDKASLSCLLSVVSPIRRLQCFSINSYDYRWPRLPKECGRSIGLFFRACSGLKEVLIENSLCKPSDLDHVAKGLETSLVEGLRLILPDGTKLEAMCAALRLNKHLRELTLIRLTDNWTADEVDKLCDVLEVNTGLKSLCLQTTERSDDDQHGRSLASLRIQALQREFPHAAEVDYW